MKRYIRSAVVNIKDESEETKWELARNPNLRPETLREIADSLSERSPWGAYVAVIENPNTPVDVLENLMRLYGGDPQVSMTIACCPNVTSELLKYIYDHSLGHRGILSCVAGNPKTPEYILKKLSQNSYSYIRAKCADNPSTPGREKLQGKLLQSFEVNVRADLARVTSEYTVLSKLARDPSNKVREMVTANPNTPSDILAISAKDADPMVRISIPTHPNTTPDINRFLSDDINSGVRQRLAWSRKTPIDVLEKLAEDTDDEVRVHAQESLDEYRSEH